MNEPKLAEQVELIRQVFGYVNHFKEKIFVIHIDSRVIAHGLFSILVRDLVLLHRLGIRIILVPGAKSRIDEILTQYGIGWTYQGGVRISSPESMPFIKMAAFDVSNSLMTLLAENRTDAVVGNWVRARGIGVRQGVDYQVAGTVDKLKIEIVKNVLDQGLIPIFPNIGWNASGKPYNLSSVELAAVISQEMMAEKLFFLTWKESISEKEFRLGANAEIDRDGIVSRLTVEEAEEFLKQNNGEGSSHLLELLDMALSSCRKGVTRVHIVDGSIEGVILKEVFSSRGFGTMVYADEYANIRPMEHSDIPEVLRIMQPLVEREILVPRSSKLLEEQCGDFVVYEVDGIVHACGALHSFSKRNGEIAAVAVDETYSSIGIGKKIVSFLLERARERDLKRVFVLTTQTFDWFSEVGFVQGEKGLLPPERKETYDSERGSVILYYDLSSS